jgi:hypothetical protein
MSAVREVAAEGVAHAASVGICSSRIFGRHMNLEARHRHPADAYIDVFGSSGAAAALAIESWWKAATSIPSSSNTRPPP